jgi:hypothetical protein
MDIREAMAEVVALDTGAEVAVVLALRVRVVQVVKAEQQVSVGQIQ